MKKYIYLFFAFFTLLGCDNRAFLDDEDIQTAFPFEFNVEAIEGYYLKSVSDISLTISNSHEVNNQDYKITYKIVGGDSEVFVSGEVVNGEFTMKKGTQKVGFKALNTGDYTVVFTASNGKSKFDQTKEVKFTVLNKPFEPTVKADAEVFRSETNQIIVNVKVQNPDWVTYAWAWNSDQINELKTMDGAVLPQKTDRTIDPNKEYQFIFNPKENAGMHILFFTFKDAQGQEVTIDLKINVKDIDFTGTLTPLKSEMNYDEIANIEFSFNPEFISKTNPNTYKVTYSFVGTEGIIKIDGKEIKNKESLVLDSYPFDKKIITFEPTAYNGSAKINLEIEDKYGYKKTISTSIEINVKTYEVFAKRLTDVYLFPNEAGGDFSVELRTLANISKMKYKVRIVSNTKDEANGYFMYNGERIDYNQDFYLTQNFQNITYHATAYGSGKHTFSLQVKDVTGASPKNEIQTLEFPIYKKLEIEKISAYYTLEKIRNGTVFRPSRWEIKAYLDFQLSGTSKIKNIELKGTYFGKPFTKNVASNIISKINNNTLLEMFIDEGQHNFDETQAHKPNDPITIIFTDEKGFKTETTIQFEEKEI